MLRIQIYAWIYWDCTIITVKKMVNTQKNQVVKRKRIINMEILLITPTLVNITLLVMSKVRFITALEMLRDKEQSSP